MNQQGVIRLKRKKASLAAYLVLLLCLVFALGYLVGHGNGETQVTVTTKTVQPAEVPEQPQVSAGNPEVPTAEAPLNINTATRAQLALLPGIGPELADRIVVYRQRNGNFVAKEQIMDVDGIGEKRYTEMEDLITIGGNP